MKLKNSEVSTRNSKVANRWRKRVKVGKTLPQYVSLDNSVFGEGDEITVEVEVPQVESLYEAIMFHGGESNVVEFLNECYVTDARNSARMVMRHETKNTLVKNARKAALAYSPNPAKHPQKKVALVRVLPQLV